MYISSLLEPDSEDEDGMFGVDEVNRGDVPVPVCVYVCVCVYVATCGNILGVVIGDTPVLDVQQVT